VSNVSGTPALVLENNAISAAAAGSPTTSVALRTQGATAPVTLTDNVFSGGAGTTSRGLLAEGAQTITSVGNQYRAGVSAASNGVAYGAAVSSPFTSANDVFVAGTANTIAGGLRVDSGTTTLTHGVFVGGTANEGVGAYVTPGATASFTNASFDGSAGTVSRVGLRSEDGATVTALSCNYHAPSGVSSACEVDDGIVCATTTTAINACTWDGCASASGSLVSDPLLNASYRLTVSSPLIDAGIPTATTLDDTDIDGDARPYGSNPDIGIDELTP
jgi:hypothetical protein